MEVIFPCHTPALCPRERNHGAYRIGGQEGFRFCQEDLEKRKIFCPCWQLNCDFSVTSCNLVTIQTGL